MEYQKFADFDSDGQLKNSYKKNGFIVLKSIIEPDFLQELLNFLNRTTKKYESNIEKYKSRYCNFTSSGKINSLHSLEKNKYINKILNSNKFVDIAKYFIGEEVKTYGSEYFAKPAETGIEVPPHQDNYYWCFNNPNVITIWMALTPVNIKNGALYYYEGSHDLGLLKHSPSNVPGSSQYIDNADRLMHSLPKSYIELNKGDILIHHSLVVHGSGANNSNQDRKGFTIRYTSMDQSINQKALKTYESSLSIQLKDRGLKNIK